MLELQPWLECDLFILERNNTARQTEHLGGPETERKLLLRHRRYLASTRPGHTRMFKIVWQSNAVGSIGYWQRAWREQSVYETGWSVFAENQGRGFAGQAAVKLIEILRREALLRYLHAFPAPDNVASNAICRKLGFEFIEECDFEYPKGHLMRSNDWRLDLQAVMPNCV